MFTSIAIITLYTSIITFLCTYLTIYIAKKFGLVDNPKKRSHPAHTHKGIIPRAGGLAIYLGIVITSLLTLSYTKQLFGILFAITILIIIGIWDDKKSRSPYIRLITNSLSALIVIILGIGIPYLTNPLGGIIKLDTLQFNFNFWGFHTIWIWADIFAFIWIIWNTNIIGWSGGIDGQLPGFVAISAIVIGLLSLRFASQDPNQIQVTYLSFITAGAFLGFLPWNFYPQKIMPGYGGKTLAGFMLAVLSILAFSKLGTALLVLVIPTIDAIFMLFKRIIAGRSPVRASSGHLHHHLLSLGWGKRRVAIFYWMISGFTGLTALLLDSKQKIFAALIILVLILGFIIGVNKVSNLTKSLENEEL